MKALTLRTRFEQAIIALNEALASLYLVTEGLTLLDSINSIAVDLAQAIEILLEDVEQVASSELIVLLRDSEALVLLEKLQDADLMSELENTLLDVTDDATSQALIELISELIEKIERKYHHLLECAQALNALISQS